MIATRWTLQHGHGTLCLQERLIALSRRARRALERELQASQQQRNRDPAPHRGSSAQPLAGPSRDPSRPQEGARGSNRRAPQGEGASARQKELSDRALKILEELSTFGRQVRGSQTVATAVCCCRCVTIMDGNHRQQRQ